MSSPENPFNNQGMRPSENEGLVGEVVELPIDLSGEEVDPEVFKRTLLASQQEIIESIHRTYEEALERFPGYDDSRLPGELVAVLAQSVGKEFHKVIEPGAYWSNNTGWIFTQMRDIKPRFHPYWIAVSEAGFIPEVRIVGSWSSYGTAHLNARITPSLDS